MVPKRGSWSQRGSIGSHQGVRMMHRTQSTKSHRRTGSRAEAKRASMLSRHTAFSSPMVSVRPGRHTAHAFPPSLPLIGRSICLQPAGELLLESFVASTFPQWSFATVLPDELPRKGVGEDTRPAK